MNRFNITTSRHSTHGTSCALSSDALRTHGRSSWIVTNTITHTEYVSGPPPVPEVAPVAPFGSTSLCQNAANETSVRVTMASAVCWKCIEDLYLRDRVKREGERLKCSVCHKTRKSISIK